MKIWTIFTLIILVIICSISLLYLVSFRTFSENARMQDLKVAHDILLKGNNFKDPIRFNELKNLKGSEHFILNIPNNNERQITNINKRRDNGDIQERQPFSPAPPFENKELRNWMAGFAQEDKMYLKQYKESFDNEKYIFIISSLDNEAVGSSYLISYIPNRKDNSLLYIVLVVGLVFIGIGFIASKIVAQVIARPLKKLEQYSLRIAKKDWKESIIIENEDEIGTLATAMNHMQRELKRADEEEKMFLQSISHDLKTPVMVIMSHADAIVDGVYVDSVEKTAEIIKEEAMSLQKKIKQLLYLNTLDYVLENNNEKEDINLHDLLLNTINRFELINSNIEWDLNIDDLVVQGNSDKLKVAIENILDNGLRYAKEKMAIALKVEDSFAHIEIYNDGPNISEEHINHIFDNHYKDKTGNFGLGLAISKKIIDFYMGEITAINREHGVSFLIKYPILK
jgi:two-component system sensor histidine kinase CssS